MTSLQTTGERRFFQNHNSSEKHRIHLSKSDAWRTAPPLFEQAAHFADELGNLIQEWDVEERNHQIQRTADENVPRHPYPAGMSLCVQDEIRAMESLKNKLQSSWWPWEWYHMELPFKAVPSCNQSSVQRGSRGRSFPDLSS